MLMFLVFAGLFDADGDEANQCEQKVCCTKSFWFCPNLSDGWLVGWQFNEPKADCKLKLLKNEREKKREFCTSVPQHYR